ncbi:hypothetical protein IV38_GL001253 [Lactobacillus selangorensis]|uniref:Microbial-type PARG catalytic domain-containing protein n=1 Tax=Lactobacillus selangorensis TaxID=81857 RepID=A0A0R2FVW7_9LACO|nr:TIGR02452 family protein [Lactobacillus selangorensis]KRN29037.1 hypothetical protein IV38_GL001253 [Lactobacillus selangorensis]KRN30049.1 hypothetical protein IV40_GL002078 [Lactobacillus selangorensis]
MSQKQNIALFQATMKQYQENPGDAQSFLIKSMAPETPGVAAGKEAPIKVVNQDVISLALQLEGHLGIMNFASPITPGGGVELGVNAQEEAIARDTYLLPELEKFTATYYRPNRDHPNHGLYTRDMIYSRHVRITQDDSGKPVQNRYTDILTVNAPNLSQAHGELTDDQIEADLEAKILNTVRVFKDEKVTVPLLGAFGTGVFGNDPTMVAQIFKRILSRPEFNGVFTTVYFAVLDPSQKTYDLFKQIL